MGILCSIAPMFERVPASQCQAVVIMMMDDIPEIVAVSNPHVCLGPDQVKPMDGIVCYL